MYRLSRFARPLFAAALVFALPQSARAINVVPQAPAPTFNIPGGMRTIDMALGVKTPPLIQFLIVNPDPNGQPWVVYPGASVQVQAGSPPMEASSALIVELSPPFTFIPAGATGVVALDVIPAQAGTYTVTFSCQLWDGSAVASLSPVASTAFIVNVADASGETANLSSTAVTPHYNLNLNAVINGSIPAAPSGTNASVMALAPVSQAAQTTGAMVVVTFMNRGNAGLTFSAGQTGVTIDAHQSSAMIMDAGGLSAGGIEVFSLGGTGQAAPYTILISAGPAAFAATATTQPAASYTAVR